MTPSSNPYAHELIDSVTAHHGLTTHQLAYLINVPYEQFCEIYNGQYDPSVRVVRKLEEIIAAG